ncbi:cytochrome c oxidase assembly protein [Gayadomonas joobiniege]|uniref:cytochrome c oxidase assembly protein n=1 Tax=Gayadomonas joobiniege TaxID=1234606 RepID=UPI0003683B95|nr:cytochrome c oxidase assembly protein [Gayadomonas joobiniege]
MDTEAAQKKLIKRLCLVVVCMFAFGFALVPLYDVFCDVTGINGRTVNRVQLTDKLPTQVDANRQLKVEFISINQGGNDWSFESLANQMLLQPGAMQEVSFNIQNHSQQDAYVQTIPSVSPGQAALYLHKLECFCFEQQKVAAGESKNFVIKFYIDTELPQNIQQLTLAYTLYPITDKVTASR